MAVPTPGTILYWLFLSIPIYIFILSPIQTMLFSGPQISSIPANYESFEKVSTLVRPSPDIHCPPHQYTIRIISRAPLIIHIPDFLSESERAHLKSAAEQHYAPSPVYHGAAQEIDRKVRNSSRALLPRTDAVQCLEQRALAFQGWPADVFVERLWAQKYETGGHYAHHFDYSGGNLKARGAGRISTFMVYVDCEGCVGGGTEFPRLSKPVGEQWCDVLDCGEQGGRRELNDGDDRTKQKEKGVVFKPVPGSAVYWENFDANGNGWSELWHSGMAVEQGTKIGLNIWSWWQPGYAEYLEQKAAKQNQEL